MAQGTGDYNEQLRNDYVNIKRKVVYGELPMPERIAEIEDAINRYIVAQDVDFEGKRAKAVAEGRSVNTVPIQYRNQSLLDALADLLMYEYLTWSHADKMSIVDDPVLSDSQMKIRHRRETSLADVYTGKGDHTIGRTRGSDGVKRRIYDYMTPERDMSLVPTAHLDLYNALDNAGLTDRQREAITLVYFEGMTQEGAGSHIGLSRNSIDTHIRIGIEKIRKYCDNLRQN